CGVSPHFDATFTRSSALPLCSAREVGSPCSDRKGMSYRDTGVLLSQGWYASLTDSLHYSLLTSKRAWMPRRSQCSTRVMTARAVGGTDDKSPSRGPGRCQKFTAFSSSLKSV